MTVKTSVSHADRYIIPLQNGAFDNFHIQPTTVYDKYLTGVLVPNYGRILSCTSPKKFTFDPPRKNLIWQLSSEPTHQVDTEMSSNFYATPLDWGKQFLAKGSSDTPTLWQRSTNSHQQLPSHETLITAVKLGPESFKLASGDGNSCLRITDIATKALLLEAPSIDGQSIFSMDWRTPNELTIGTTDNVYHMDLRSGDTYPIEMPNAQKICALAWKEDGTMCAVGSNDDHARVFDLRRLNHPNLLHKHTHKAAVKALRWIPNCKEPLLLSGGATNCKTFKVVNVNDHSVACEEPTKAQICSVAFIGDRYFIAGFGFGIKKDNLQLWRYLPDSSRLEKVCSKTMSERVLNVTCEPKRPFIAASSSLGHLEVWQMQPTKKPKSSNPTSSIFDKFTVR